MRVKEAINEIRSKSNEFGSPKINDLILKLYLNEFSLRQHSRFHNNDVSVFAFDSLNTEMTEWIRKVMIGLNIPENVAEEYSSTLQNKTSVIVKRYKRG